jgi:hypothetical protein
MSSFSQRQGYVRPKEIQFTEELPERPRIPIYEILRDNLNPTSLLERTEKLFNPYGIDSLPTHTGSILVAKEEDDPGHYSFQTSIPGMRVVSGLRLEDAFAELRFHGFSGSNRSLSQLLTD